MQRNEKLARDLIDLNDAIQQHNDATSEQFEQLADTQFHLSQLVKAAEDAKSNYKSLASASNSQDETAETPAKKPSLIARLIDQRIEKKCQQYLDAEIERLIALRQKTNPNSSELDVVFIRQTLQRDANSWIKRHKSCLKGCRDSLLVDVACTALVVTGVVIGLALGAYLTAGLVAIIALPFFLLYGGLDLKKLLRVNKDFAANLAPTIEKMEDFAKSDKTFEQLLEKRIKQAKILLQETEFATNRHRRATNDVDAAHLPKPSVHRHKHRHHHKASNHRKITKHAFFANHHTTKYPGDEVSEEIVMKRRAR